MSKVALKLVKGNSYFCDGFLSIGVYIQGKVAILIDSGGDENSAKDVYNAIQNAGYEVKAIINTHCHPDHCGGNYFFQKKYPELRVYATHAEKEFIEDPDLAPRCFCGGAAPFSGLKNKYIAPQKPSKITDVIAPYHDQTISIYGADFNIITLPGHTPGSIGVITPDNVLYSGDALFGKETFNKHAILFYTDIGNTLLSLDKLALLKIDAAVFYHGGMTHAISSAVEKHKNRILETKDSVLTLLKQQSLSIDMLTQQIMQLHNIPNTIVSFTLTQTAMRAYLAQLEAEKAIEMVVQNGLLQAVVHTS